VTSTTGMAASTKCGARATAFGNCSSPVGYGEHYKYEIKNYDGHIYEKSDPYGFQQEIRPKTASIVTDLDAYEWQDADWMEQRRQTEPLDHPVSVYEVHLGSWLHASSAIRHSCPTARFNPLW
jgi:1,4-alpha-glucan branching enzyme